MNESLSLAQRKRSIHRSISPQSVRNSPFFRFFFPFFSPLFSNNINRAKIKIKPRFEGSSKRRRMWNLCGRRDSKKKKRRKKWHRYCARAHTYTHIQHTPPLHTPEACRAAGSRRFVDSSCSFARAPFPKHHFFRQIRASLHPRFSWVTGQVV